MLWMKIYCCNFAMCLNKKRVAQSDDTGTRREPSLEIVVISDANGWFGGAWANSQNS